MLLLCLALALLGKAEMYIDVYSDVYGGFLAHGNARAVEAVRDVEPSPSRLYHSIPLY